MNFMKNTVNFVLLAEFINRRPVPRARTILGTVSIARLVQKVFTIHWVHSIKSQKFNRSEAYNNNSKKKGLFVELEGQIIVENPS